MAGIPVSGVRRTAVAMAAVLCATFAAGCYTLVPSASSLLAPGKQVALELNDVGRLNLAGQIGGDVMRVQGALVQQSSAGYTLKVTQLTYLNGRTAEWSGEAVTVRDDYARGVYEYKISSSRTAGAVLAGAAVVGGLIAAKGITGSGDTSNPTKPTPPTPPVGSRGIH